VRIEGWEAQLNTYLHNAVEFAWGQNDCALWCSDWVNIATGQDFTGEWRGQYETEEELNALLIERGFTGPADIPASVGLAEIYPLNAQRGDIILNAQGCLGICNGINSYFLMERGITTFRTRACVRAWRVE
jgi:hypothetical protein